MAKKLKKVHFALVLWKNSSNKESINIYNLRHGTMETMNLNKTGCDHWHSSDHSWPDLESILNANNGTSATLLDTWVEYE